MDIEALKEHILENDLIEKILEALGCHHIRKRDGFIQAANPDGDNTTAVCVYENTNLTTINYTRDITNGRKSSDIISLVEFYKKESFPYAVKWICDELDIDYYKNAITNADIGRYGCRRRKTFETNTGKNIVILRAVCKRDV